MENSDTILDNLQIIKMHRHRSSSASLELSPNINQLSNQIKEKRQYMQISQSTKIYSNLLVRQERLKYQEKQRHKAYMKETLDKRLQNFLDFINFMLKKLEQANHYQNDMNYQKDFDVLFNRLLKNLQEEQLLIIMIFQDIKLNQPQIKSLKNNLPIYFFDKSRKLQFELKRFHQKRSGKIFDSKNIEKQSQQLYLKISKKQNFTLLFSFAQKYPDFQILHQDSQNKYFLEQQYKYDNKVLQRQRFIQQKLHKRYPYN